MQTLRFVEQKRHAGMNVLVWTKTVSAHKCRVGLHCFVMILLPWLAQLQASANCFDFQFHFLCGDFRKIQLLRNFLQSIFTSCVAAAVFTLCVPQALTVFHKAQHQRCVVVLPFKNCSRLFSKRTIEKETRQQTEAPAEEHAVTRLFILFTFDDSSRMINPKRTKVGPGQHVSSSSLDDHFCWIDCLHRSLLMIHPKSSSKVNNVNQPLDRKLSPCEQASTAVNFTVQTQCGKKRTGSANVSEFRFVSKAVWKYESKSTVLPS